MEQEQYFESTKSYYNYPCAHRQFRHNGNCAKIHGYSRSFHFKFAAKTLTKEGFVVDSKEDYLSFSWQSVEELKAINFLPAPMIALIEHSLSDAPAAHFG